MYSLRARKFDFRFHGAQYKQRSLWPKSLTFPISTTTLFVTSDSERRGLRSCDNSAQLCVFLACTRDVFRGVMCHNYIYETRHVLRGHLPDENSCDAWTRRRAPRPLFLYAVFDSVFPGRKQFARSRDHFAAHR